MSVANPATPPAGLSLSGNSLNNGQITSKGLRRASGGNPNCALWVEDNVYTGDIVRIEVTLNNVAPDTYSAYTVPGPAVIDTNGVAYTGGNLVASNAVYFFGKSLSAAGTGLGNTRGGPVANTDYRAALLDPITVGTKIVLYHNRVTGRIFCFWNDKNLLGSYWGTVTGVGSAFKYGVCVGSPNGHEISSLVITDENVSIPLGIWVNTTDTNRVAYATTKPTKKVLGYRYTGIPFDAYWRDGALYVSKISAIDLSDNLNAISPALANGILEAHTADGIIKTPVQTLSSQPIRWSGAGAVGVFNPDDTLNVNLAAGSGGNLSVGIGSFYNTQIGRAIPGGSAIAYQAPTGVTLNATTGLFEGLSSPASLGVIIWDFTDKRIRYFTASVNSDGTINSLTRNQDKFLTSYDVDLNSTAESEAVKVIDLLPNIGADTASLISIDAEINVYNGSTWSGYQTKTSGTELTVTSAYQIKLRHKTSQLSDSPRKSTLVMSLNGVDYNKTWTSRTKRDLTRPNPLVTDNVKQFIIGRVAEANNTLVAPQLDISAPSSYSGMEAPNTTVTVSGTTHSGLTGTVDVHYTRYDIAKLKNYNGRLDVSVGASKTWAEVMAAISTQYGLNLTTDDYTDNPSYTPLASGTSTSETLTIKSGSLGYIGSITLEITVV